MNQEDETKTPAEFAPGESGEQSEPVSPGPVKLAQPETDRVQHLLRKASIWLAILLVFFFAGAAADHFLRYKPLSDSLSETRSALDQAQQDVADLQIEIDRMDATLQQNKTTIASLESSNESLQEQLARAETRLKLMQVLADVNEARLALSRDDVEGAKAALQDTQQELEALLPQIETFGSDLAERLPQRLTLIQSGLERDNLEAVNIDIELFIQDLLGIEAAITGG
jgi:predicted  nucleic acid-binding Zn-ribbon protein